MLAGERRLQCRCWQRSRGDAGMALGIRCVVRLGGSQQLVEPPAVGWQDARMVEALELGPGLVGHPVQWGAAAEVEARCPPGDRNWDWRCG